MTKSPSGFARPCPGRGIDNMSFGEKTSGDDFSSNCKFAWFAGFPPSASGIWMVAFALVARRTLSNKDSILTRRVQDGVLCTPR